MPRFPSASQRALPLCLVALALVAGACGRGRGGGGDRPLPASPEPPHLVLNVEPANGDVPLTVRLEARLVGEVADPERFRCPSLAWTLGNGDVVLARAADCGAEGVRREFALDYTYETAGSYTASVRLLAMDVPRSPAVSVLVRGPTPTPADVAAVPGPTIVIATARLPSPAPELPPTIATRPTVAAATGVTAVAATVLAQVPAATLRPATIAPRATEVPTEQDRDPGLPSPTALPTFLVPTVAAPVAVAGQVLPADLYFLTRRPPGLWRLPASGGSPLAVVPDRVVTDYAAAGNGLVAYVTGEGALYLLAPGTQAVRLVAGGASNPIWSPDGRRLAYAGAGVTVYDLATARRGELAPQGQPLGWSRDGQWLALRRPDGGLTLVSSAGARTDLPVGPVHSAGWLADRNVLWLTGSGLELLTVGDSLELATLAGPDVRVRAVATTTDGRLLAVVDSAAGPRLQVFDLLAERLTGRVSGPPLDLPAGDETLAWAPDGRTLAVAGPEGLRLVAPETGAALPLFPALAAAPQWVLGAP